MELADGRAVHPVQIEHFARQDPVAAALLGEHVEALHHYPFYGDKMWCVLEDERVQGLCWTGGNIVPFRLGAAGTQMVAGRMRGRRRRFSSVVGPAEDVLQLWEHIKDDCPPPREIRANQPSMVLQAPPLIAANEDVKLTSKDDLDLLTKACVAMFIEEVGYSPLGAGGGYERRVRFLVDSKRSLSWITETDNGREVIFKAELGTVALGVTQVQGVWVNPRYRGQGFAGAGMAAVVNYARSHIAPIVSLYVNAYNTRAIAVYRNVGFRQVGTFATVLL